VFVVVREAIARSKRLALSRVVIARRERAVAIRPMGRGLVAHTLHEARDINSPAHLFESIPAIKPDPAMVDLAVQLVDRETGKFDIADMEDRYEARLRAVIDAKLKGEHLEPEPEPEDSGNVIDLMAALKRSVGQAKNSARAPAAKPRSAPRKKAPPAKPGKPHARRRA
jgi:DNA end-binding protein Ku